MIELEELIEHIRRVWPDRYERGRVVQIHKNAITLEDGSRVHLRVMVQHVSEQEFTHAFVNASNALNDSDV